MGYWVWWPREAASKGFEKGTDLNVVAKWDGAFNLTASYRRDSDVTRRWGSRSRVTHDMTWDAVRNEYTPIETQKKKLLELKNTPKHNKSSNHTIWFVSNCDATNGARQRWSY